MLEILVVILTVVTNCTYLTSQHVCTTYALFFGNTRTHETRDFKLGLVLPFAPEREVPNLIIVDGDAVSSTLSLSLNSIRVFHGCQCFSDLFSVCLPIVVFFSQTRHLEL